MVYPQFEAIPPLVGVPARVGAILVTGGIAPPLGPPIASNTKKIIERYVYPVDSSKQRTRLRKKLIWRSVSCAPYLVITMLTVEPLNKVQFV